ncbi:MAG: ABC transporter permease [Candidatus Nanopelagicales bacterium]
MSAVVPDPAPAPDGQDLRALAAQFGLTSTSKRQPMGSYLAELYSRRDFVVAMGTGRRSAQYRDTSLGRLWQVIGPILNAIVYYFIFGVLLQTSKGVDNFPAFLIIGVFTFTYTQRVVTGSTKSIANNRGMIRAIHFPRAVMPLSVIVQEVQQQVVSLGVLGIIVLLTGEPLTWLWLGVLPILVLQSIFNTGLGMMVARWTAASRDVAQLVPFVMHTWRYLSGVMFSIPVFTADLAPWVKDVLYLNPMTGYLELMRGCLLSDYPVPAWLWALAAGWAVLFLVVGFVLFWRAEETYSRG